MKSARVIKARQAVALMDGESTRDREAIRRYFDGDTHTSIWLALKYPSLQSVRDLCAKYKALRGPTVLADIEALRSLDASLNECL